MKSTQRIVWLAHLLLTGYTPWQLLISGGSVEPKYMVRRYCALAVVTVVFETCHGSLPQYKSSQCCIWHQN